jgi:hypothetical protein
MAITRPISLSARSPIPLPIGVVATPINIGSAHYSDLLPISYLPHCNNPQYPHIAPSWVCNHQFSLAVLPSTNYSFKNYSNVFFQMGTCENIMVVNIPYKRYNII